MLVTDKRETVAEADIMLFECDMWAGRPHGAIVTNTGKHAAIVTMVAVLSKQHPDNLAAAPLDTWQVEPGQSIALEIGDARVAFDAVQIVGRCADSGKSTIVRFTVGRRESNQHPNW